MILQSKIDPVNLRPSSKTIYKASVVDFVKDNLDKNVFIVKGPAGYGKSTVVWDVVDYTRIPYAYYRIDSGDDNLHRFFSYLTGAIRNLLPEFGSETRNYLDSFSDELSRENPVKSKADTLISLFINELYRIRTNTFIVLNDFHFLSPVLNDAVYSLLQNVSPNIKFILVTRDELKLNIAGLISKRKAAVIGTDLLSFTPEEIREIALNLYKKDISKEDANHLKELTEGWVTGIHLFLQSDHSPDTDKKLPEEIYSFFAEEIFNELNKSEKKFLLHTSLLKNFNEDISKHIFDKMDITHLTGLLMERNIFLKKTAREKGSIQYSYNILFRKFLQDKFEAEIPSEEKKKVFYTAGQYYEKVNDPAAAIDFFARAEKYDKMIKMIKKNIRKLLSNDPVLADRWLNYIPEELKDNDSELLYCRALLLKNLHAELDAAEYMFKKIQSMKPLDEQMDIKCSAYLAEILLKREEYEKAEDVLSKSIKKFKGPFVSNLYFKLGNVFLLTGKYSKSEKSLKTAIEIIDEAGKNPELESLKYQIHNSLGGINLSKGNLTESSYYFEMAAGKMTSHFNQFQVYYNMAYVNIMSGNFQKAKEAMNRLDTFGVLKDIPELKSLYIMGYMIYYFESGNYETSLKFCDAMLAHSNSINHLDNKFVALLHFVYNYIYLSDNMKAKKYLSLAQECITETMETQKAELEQAEAMLKKTEGDLNFAEKKLLEINTYLSELEIDTDNVTVEFHLADIYFRKGAKERALKFLKSAIEGSQKTGYVNIFRRELLFNKDIFDLAEREKVNRDFISDIYAYIFSEEFTSIVSDLSRDRVTQAVQNLYGVRLYTLGQNKIYVNGVLVDDKKWTRKNFKEIFIYFILNRKDHLSKELIIDKFLDDVPFEHADNVFHQLVSCFRGVLKTGNKSKSDDTFLEYKNKILSLSESHYYYSDVEEFLSAFKMLSTVKSPDISKLRGAIDLYKGGFMPDNYNEWVEEIRTELDDKYNKLLHKAMDMSITGKNYGDVIYFSELLIKNDTLNEKAYKENIKAYVLTDNKKTARAKLTSMKTSFMKDLGEPPSKKILSELEALIN